MKEAADITHISAGECLLPDLERSSNGSLPCELHFCGSQLYAEIPRTSQWLQLYTRSAVLNLFGAQGLIWWKTVFPQNRRGEGWGLVSGWLKHIAFIVHGFLKSSVGKESDFNAGDPGSIHGSGRSAGEGIGYPLGYSWASLVALLVKNTSAMRETWVRSLGWKDPLEKGKATHSNILAWRNPRTV